MTSINADFSLHNPLMARARARRALAFAAGGFFCALTVAVVGSVAVSAKTGSGATTGRALKAVVAQAPAVAPSRKVRIIQIHAISEDQKAMARR